MLATAARTGERIAPDTAPQRFSCTLATRSDEVLESQRLRYRVFAEEMGAAIDGGRQKIDRDHYDTFCHHLLVRNVQTGQVVASTRILTDAQAKAAGGFYSEDEFDLSGVLTLRGRKMEIGRTCVHPDHRNGATLGVLWSGLGAFITERGFDHLFGCASIELAEGVERAHAINLMLRQKHSVPEHLRVRPKLPLPAADLALPSNPRMPPLLKTYVSLGAKSCGDACWDPDFGVADILMLLQVEDVCPRYARHFFQRPASAAKPGDAVTHRA